MIISLVTIILLSLGYSIASLFQTVKFDIGDDEAEFATKWLQQSNNAPQACRKLTANREQWFDRFLKDRQSLGSLKSRYLKSKQSAGKRNKRTAK